MECRRECGACCIAPSIARPFYGMPEGKPAGTRCVHLDDAMCCGIFFDSRRPEVCASFSPEPEVCGSNREEALQRLQRLEVQTL
ncbi:MAG: YkgJ family cysteine cluster protein [Halioglobus sp.]